MLPILPDHRPEQFARRRGSEPLVLVMLAFAASLVACGVAGLVAWQRCGSGDDCSAELAISILGLAPAALLLSVMLLLIGAQLHSGSTHRVTVALAVGVSVLPLTAFTMGDVIGSAIGSILLTALAFSLLSRLAERREPIATAPDEVTLFEQTRAVRIRRVLPLLTPDDIPDAARTTALPLEPTVDGTASERLSALLERASDLDVRATMLSLRFTRETVPIDRTPSSEQREPPVAESNAALDGSLAS